MRSYVGPLLALLTLLPLGLAGCAPADGADEASRIARGGTVRVVASFYPLQFVAQRVGGDRVAVTSLTKPGGEPHDLELTPRDVAGMEKSDLVVYLHGFQPAVDDAVSGQPAGKALDVTRAARTTLRFAPGEVAGTVNEQAGSTDPHFWLDPTRLADVATAVSERLQRLDPQHAATYRANAVALRADLAALDRELATGLGACRVRDLVTSHTAFGYLADRYHLHQVGITGLNPEAEPQPQELASVARYVRAHHVSTVYSETLVSPAVARTVAEETGARTAVLDPLEGLTDASRGSDYLQVMRSDLATLRAGQDCA